MKRITEAMIKDEMDRMYVERELFGRFLYSWESETFWKAQRPRKQLRQRLMSAIRHLWADKNATTKGEQ